MYADIISDLALTAMNTPVISRKNPELPDSISHSPSAGDRPAEERAGAAASRVAR